MSTPHSSAGWIGVNRETPPTAPPVALGGGYTTSGASSSSRSSGGSPADAPSRDVIAQLYQDMLRSAGGDPQLVALRLAEMGFKPADVQEEQQQQQSIKAVGGGAGGLSPWGSLPSKQSLKRNPGPPPRGDRDLDGQAAEAGAPSHFFCPVSLQIMRDPVLIAATGQTYDRPCIERWLAAGHCSCPATGVALTPPVSLVPNVALRGSIEDWAEKHAPWLLDGDRRVKPIPKDEQFGGMPAAGRAGGDADLAFAIQLQQEELQRLAQQRAAVGAAGVAGAGAAPGVAAFGVDSRGAGAPGGGGPGRQRGGAAARRGRGCLRGWLSPTAALLFGATAAYIALFVVSLALNGWNIENLALNPWAGSSPTALMEVGAQEADAVASGGQWWRLLSSPFVSAGVIQLLLNMSCLWTLGRHLEAALAPRPAPAIAATYLLGGWAGALASANLNHYYITCGASAGVCALLGAVWADQLLQAGKYVSRLWTVLVLGLLTGVYIVMSLLPLMDPWYQAAALLTGFLTGSAALLAARVARDRRRNRAALVALVHCVLLLAGGVAVGVVGVVLNARVGEGSSFLKGSCCQGLGSWQCVVSTGSPSGCVVEAAANGTRVLYCPTGEPNNLPSGTSIPPGDTSLITQLCSQYCTAADSPTPSNGGDAGTPDAGGGGDGGDSSGGGASPAPASNTTTPVGGGSDGISI